MADSPVSGLPSLSAPTTDDLLLVTDLHDISGVPVSKKSTIAQVLAASHTVIGTSVFQCTLYLTASSQNITQNSETPVIWTAVRFDDASFWSGGAPALITVPAGAKRIQLTANFRWNTTTPGFNMFAKIKDSAGITWATTTVVASCPGSNFPNVSLTTPVIDLANAPATNYFLTAFQDTSGALAVQQGSTFSATVWK